MAGARLASAPSLALKPQMVAEDYFVVCVLSRNSIVVYWIRFDSISSRLTHHPRPFVGVSQKSIFKRPCQVLAINAHKMAPRTG